jgi:hypothetical protein
MTTEEEGLCAGDSNTKGAGEFNKDAPEASTEIELIVLTDMKLATGGGITSTTGVG